MHATRGPSPDRELPERLPMRSGTSRQWLQRRRQRMALVLRRSVSGIMPPLLSERALPPFAAQTKASSVCQ